MKSLAHAVNKIAQRQPGIGLPDVLRQAVEGKHYSPITISRAMNALLTKGDFGELDYAEVKKQLFGDLLRASNPIEEVSKSEGPASQSVL